MAKAPKKNAKYKMPDPIPQGFILEDSFKKKWRLGPSIGKGGFGEIYSAQEAEKTGSSYPYAVKIEPHSNGPLFVEMHFYRRNIKPDCVEDFKKKHKLKTFGMPLAWGSGTQEYNKEKYRFLVMDKFGDDIVKIMKASGGKFSPEIAYKLAWQMTYVLEFIHSLGYIHADLKAANILMGSTETTKGQAYLVDYGLAERYSTDKEYKPDPKSAHNGTIEYLSRDAHCGVATRRGDFEVLAHNLMDWLGYELPWISQIKKPVEVQKLKQKLWDDPGTYITKHKVDNTLKNFMNYVAKLEFYEEPNYNKIREFFSTGVKNAGGSVTTLLKFDAKIKSPTKRKSVGKSPGPTPKKSKTKPTPKKKAETSVEINEGEEDEANCEVVMNAEMKKYMDKLAEKKKPRKNGAVKKVVKKSPTKRSVKTSPESTNGSEKENSVSERPRRRIARVASYAD